MRPAHPAPGGTRRASGLPCPAQLRRGPGAAAERPVQAAAACWPLWPQGPCHLLLGCCRALAPTSALAPTLCGLGRGLLGDGSELWHGQVSMWAKACIDDPAAAATAATAGDRAKQGDATQHRSRQEHGRHSRGGPAPIAPHARQSCTPPHPFPVMMSWGSPTVALHASLWQHWRRRGRAAGLWWCLALPWRRRLLTTSAS